MKLNSTWEELISRFQWSCTHLEQPHLGHQLKLISLFSHFTHLEHCIDWEIIQFFNWFLFLIFPNIFQFRLPSTCPQLFSCLILLKKSKTPRAGRHPLRNTFWHLRNTFWEILFEKYVLRNTFLMFNTFEEVKHPELVTWFNNSWCHTGIWETIW